MFNYATTIFQILKRKFLLKGAPMIVVMSVLVLFILIFCSLFTWFIVVNQADPRLLEMITPIVGALIISITWAIKLIYSDMPGKIRLKSSVVNIEYIGGGQIPVLHGLQNKSLELSENLLWNQYINHWNDLFLNKREADNFEGPGKFDLIHYQFFEYFILKHLAERFGMGWNHDATLMVKTPWGKNGTESYGVHAEKLDRVFLRQKLNLNEFPNKFISGDSQDLYYQISVPKGSSVKIDRSENGLLITVTHKRFTFKFGFEMAKAIFTASALEGNLVYPLFQQLQKKYGSIGRARNTHEILMRTFTISSEFEQESLYRFNKDADLDKIFAQNIWSYFESNLSWPKLEKWYQEAAFN